MDPKRELTIVCAEASATSVDSLPGVRRDQFARKLVGSELAGICDEIGFMCDGDLVFWNERHNLRSAQGRKRVFSRLNH